MHYAYSIAFLHVMPIRWAKICYRDQLSLVLVCVLLLPLTKIAAFAEYSANFKYLEIFEHAFF